MVEKNIFKAVYTVMNSQPVRNEYSIQNYLSLQRIQTKMRQPNKKGDERIIDGISEAGCFFYVSAGFRYFLGRD